MDTPKSTFHFWLFIQNETFSSHHFCKHLACFIDFTCLFSMAVFSLSHSINSALALDQWHPFSPPPKCLTFFLVSFCYIQSYRFLCFQRWGIADWYAYVYIHEHTEITCTCSHFPSKESCPGQAVWAFGGAVPCSRLPGQCSEKVLTPFLLLSNFLVCNSGWQRVNETIKA